MIKLNYFAIVAVLLLNGCATNTQTAEMDNFPNQPLPATKNSSNVDRSKMESIAADQTVQSDETKQTGNKTTADNKAVKVSNAAANAISSWEISGAMAARSKNKAWSASINWVQRGLNSYQIRLFGPLGSGTIMIQKQGGVISFRDGPKSATSSNAEQLLLKQTGVRLPVNSLYYWVRGIAAPGSVQSVAKDASGHLSLLRQGGYTIQYLAYTKAGNAYLPSQIKLQGNGIFIKLIIKNWRL